EPDAVGGDDQVSTERIRLAGDGHLLPSGTEARLRGGAARVDARDEQAVRSGQPEQPGDLGSDGLRADAEERVLRVPGLDDLRGDRLDGVDRDREAEPDGAAGVALDLGVDADTVAVRVEQRATRVAVVERGVGLDDVIDRVLAVGRGNHALQGADDAGRGRPIEAEGVPDRDHRVADVHVVRVSEREGRERARVNVDLEHGYVVRRIGPDDSSLHALVVREADADRPRALDDVVVRDDVSRLVDHGARAQGARV